MVGSEASPAIIELSQNQGIFSGLRILGKARPSATAGRLQIDLNQLVARSGRTFPVKAVALDDAGALGLEAQVFSGKALALAGAMAASLVSGVAASQQTLTPTVLGFGEPKPTGRNALLQGVAQTAADQSHRFIEEATQEKPVLLVEPGALVAIYFEEEVRF
ncbi:TrbI/VirB10 family protein [Bdellovibrionota bacterium FG-1]